MARILEIRDLVKTYGKLTAVDHVSFAIEEGEIFSLLGPNGAGKTTTISMISTLIEPSSGEIQVFGHSTVREPMEVRRRIGVVPQEIALYNLLTARENLVYWGKMYGLSGETLTRRVAEVLDQIGLAERANDAVKTYSGGMKRRVNIAVALLHKPSLLIMDEPTVGIDPQSRRNILDAVKALNEGGLTVLYTTHYMEEAQELSNRVGVIDHGQMIAVGTQKELTELVGENESLCLQLSELANPAPFLDNLAQMPGVVRTSMTGQEIVLVVKNASEALPLAVLEAERQHVKLRAIEIHEPNLEAVFLHLTGRALRD